jgi:hypothetical protein
LDFSTRRHGNHGSTWRKKLRRSDKIIRCFCANLKFSAPSSSRFKRAR